MWHGLSLTLLLVASMARSSGSTGSSGCPDNCECTIIGDNDEAVGDKKVNDSAEVRCRSGSRLEALPEITRILVIRDTQPFQVRGLMFDLENNGNIDLRELAVTNCSLKNFAVRLGRISKGFTTCLDLSWNEIEEIRGLTIGDCEVLAELDLSSNLVARIKSEAFLDYRKLLKLNLRRNSIKTIEADGFLGLDRLESLDLSDNRLVSLAEDTFVPLRCLKSLNLSGNRLGVLGRQWFDNLGHLLRLDVSRNERKPVDLVTPETSSRSEELSLVLGNVRRLEMIDASRIGLERVPSSLTRSVRFLNLSGNKLSLIRGGDFDSYPLLRVLDLSHNSITLVENDALGRLEILQKLDLTGNKLRELPQSLPADLRQLIARENLIVKLARRDLEGLGKLESLLLDGNRITEIEEASMSQLLLLNHLDLSDNPIKQLPADTFGGPANLVVLRISGIWTLEREGEKPADTAFPLPAPERLVHLDLSGSPLLAAQLLADEAALTACKSLRRLDIARTNLTELRSDLPYLIPQLRTLGLSGNNWNCENDDDRINWLARWIGEHEEISPPGQCTFYNGTKILLRELPIARYYKTTEISTTRVTAVVDRAHERSDSFGASQSSSGQRRFFKTLGPHPGIIVLAGTTIFFLALALALLLSRRKISSVEQQSDRYDQRRPILTELW